MSAAAYDRKIRGIMDRSGRLRPEQLDQATEISLRDRVQLAVTLTENGLVSERDLAGLIAREANLPPVELDTIEIDPAAIALVDRADAEANGLIPLSKIGSLLTVAFSDPFSLPVLDHLRTQTGCDLRPVVAAPAAIRRVVIAIYRRDEQKMEELLGAKEGDIEVSSHDTDLASIDLADGGDGEEESKIVKAVNTILFEAASDRASDIHIEPFERSTRVRFRKDGVLSQVHELGKGTHNAIISRLKIMGQLDIAEKRRPQDGKFQIRVNGRQIDLRLSILPTVHGEKAVMRLLDSSNLVLSLEDLGFETQCLEQLRRAIAAPYGMILVTGPTGSGKSTTLYSVVSELKTEGDNFVTVEDPVEYQLDGVNQVPVNVKRGLTFATALRSILRQDPDVIMIGEIRDTESLDIAIKAALTGHLVLSTLHTNDAPSTITRMIQMGIDPFLVASSTVLVAAQRLARKLCTHCKKIVDVPKARLIEIGMTATEAADARVYSAVGCTKCNQGYKGRFAVLEVLEVSDKVKEIIVKGGNEMDVRRAAIETGMITLRRAGLANARRGLTSIEEVLRISTADEQRPLNPYKGVLDRKQAADDDSRSED